MSGDELLVLLVSLVLASALWLPWLRSVAAVGPLSDTWALRVPVLAAPFAAAALLFATLRTLAAHDVRDDGTYLFFYMALGAAWVAVATRVQRWLGVSAREDVAERGNAAAACAVVGGILGATCCFAGSNIGDGPGWWCVVWTAALATAAWFALWRIVDRRATVTEAIVVERDLPSGVRFGAWLVAAGLVLGRAAAGDWTGPGAAAVDFVRVGWPAAVLAALALAVEPLARPTASRPRPSLVFAGLVPAALHVAAAVWWLRHTRPWS